LGNVLEETRRLSLSDDNISSRTVYESFSNLDEAMAIAIQNSLIESEGVRKTSLFESFRNLDGALKQAMAASLENADVCTVGGGGGKGARGNLCESFSDLDDAMALAIKLSLGDDADKNKKFGGRGYQYLDSFEEYDSSERDGSSILDVSYISSYSRVDLIAEGTPQLSRSDRERAIRRLEQGKADASSKSAGILELVESWGD
jgi:hypothetical protein